MIFYSKILSYINIILNILGLAVVILSIHNAVFINNSQTVFFIIIFAAIGLIASILSVKKFTFFFLINLFVVLLTLRLGALNNLKIIMIIYSLAFAINVIQFFNVVYKNQTQIGLLSWHLIFIRMYLGLDLINHSVEKLFAGTLVRNVDVHYFASVGFENNALFMVVVAGLCEFFGAIGVGLGVCTRLASIGTTLYLFISTFAGNHFGIGFIWATPGGGYEFPLLWMILILSFIITGGQKFSIDNVAQEYFQNKKSIFSKTILFLTK